MDPTGVFKNKLIDVNPSGRLGEQEELANFILYLSSDYSYFLNGQIINFDGEVLKFGDVNEKILINFINTFPTFYICRG